MWKALIDLFESSSDAKKLTLKEKSRNIRMGKNEPIFTYLSKFSQVRDELGGVGEIGPPTDLVSLALLGLHKYWHNF